MKRSIILLSAYAFIAVAILSGCGASSNDIENNRNKVSADDQEYQSDISKTTSEFFDRVSGNDTTFDNFETRLEEQNKDSKEDNQKKLEAIQQKNGDMRSRLENYKEEGKDKWIVFKVDFNSGMDTIAKEYHELTISNDQTPVQTADNN